jgi:hypothetical protein
MKTLAFAVLVTVAGASAAFAADDQATARQELVETARESKATRRKSTSRVITNADVKKSKGKIQTTNAPSTPVVREPTLMETHLAKRAEENAAAARKAKYATLIAQLEKELAEIEQSYYNENDLSRRDTVIVKRFNDVKAKLDEARLAAGETSAPEGEPPPSRD